MCSVLGGPSPAKGASQNGTDLLLRDVLAERGHAQQLREGWEDLLAHHFPDGADTWFVTLTWDPKRFGGRREQTPAQEVLNPAPPIVFRYPALPNRVDKNGERMPPRLRVPLSGLRRRDEHPERAPEERREKALRVFLRKLNHTYWGTRGWERRGQTIAHVVAWEKHKNGREHAHLLVYAPDLNTRVWRCGRGGAIDLWWRLAGIARIESVRSVGGVIGYVTKYVCKEAQEGTITPPQPFVGGTAQPGLY